MWEKHCFSWCDETKEVLRWSSEEIIIPYFFEVDKKYHRYFLDLKIVFKDKGTYLIEIKPHKQTTPPKKPKNAKSRQYISEALTYVKNRQKWEAADKYAKDRGWKFEIWTENELNAMNILPKVPGKIKKLKPFRKKKKV